MNDREAALQYTGDAAAGAAMQLENAKGWLDDLTPEEAKLWFLAWQACDRLYRAVNKP
jgi:hypothetical protein